jgi:hypothetical protein
VASDSWSLRPPPRILLAAGLLVLSGVAFAGAASEQKAGGSPAHRLQAALAPAVPLYGIAGPRPVGLRRVDPRTLRALPGRRLQLAAHTFDPEATRAEFVSGTLLAFGFRWDSRERKFSGSGLTGYALDGSPTFHRYGNDPISGVEPLGTRILVAGAAGNRIFRRGALLEARTGRELRRVRFDIQLLAGDQPFWY